MPTTKKTAVVSSAKPAAGKPADKEKKAEKKPLTPRKRAPKVAKPAATPTVTAPAAVAAPSAAPVVTAPSEVTETAPKDIGSRYIFAIGRRKRATAKVKMWLNGKAGISVNGKKFDVYFTVGELRDSLTAPLKAVGLDDKALIEVIVAGGGIRGQAEAARHGISRALVALNETYRKTLKKMGFLTRDPREKERKKPGLKRARKGSQWAKR